MGAAAAAAAAAENLDGITIRDQLEISNDPEVERLIKKATKNSTEKILYSGRIVKITSKGLWNIRVAIITDKAFYNVPVNDYSVCKRRVQLDKICGITCSRISSEMVLHVPTEYDFRFQTFDKTEIIEVLNAIRKKTKTQEIPISWVFDFFLAHLTNTRENVMTGGVPSASSSVVPSSGTNSGAGKSEGKDASVTDARNSHRPTLAQERVDQYVAAKQSARGSEPTVKDEDDPENGGAAEPVETIDLPNSSEEEKKHVTIDDFDLLKVLGRGAFGKVMQARKKDTGKIYAIKVLKKSMVYQRKQVAHTQAERKILEAAQHPFLMGLRFAFQSETKLYLVMDFYSGGELFFHLKKKKKFSEEEARIIVAEVALALGHLHKNNFIYRDLKPENVLLHETGHVCVTDFGLSKALEQDQKDTRTMCGTPEYLPPEVLTGKKHNKNVDWWALGCLLFEMCTGITPFHSSTMESLVRKVEKGIVKFPKYMSDDCKDLISQLLQVNPKMRIGAGESDVEEIKQHKWFSSVDWDRLVRKEVIPVYLPKEDPNEQALNFDPEFTDEAPIDSYVPEKGIPKTDDFKDFSFVADDRFIKDSVIASPRGTDVVRDSEIDDERGRASSFDKVDQFLKKKN
eukprot:TRINITY_DN1941_c0_g2_i3.p1 TRINITY_DN1941_c0_g2~~TRINITY_DN1941_c0_g2_i3.p1  ORF type:complete len:627 (+),score=177.74 TRINITY_DN1941_c0_g2_i3:1417-3297(+)